MKPGRQIAPDKKSSINQTGEKICNDLSPVFLFSFLKSNQRRVIPSFLRNDFISRDSPCSLPFVTDAIIRIRPADAMLRQQ